MTWFLPLSLLGCRDDAPPTAPALVCMESGREDVPLDTVADGFTTAPQAAINGIGGAWHGWFDSDFADAERLDAWMDVTYYGAPVVLVRQLLLQPVETEAGWEDRWVEDPQCPPWQEISFGASLSVTGGLLDEATAATVVVGPDGSAEFNLRLPNDQVRGTATPPWDPGLWDTVELVLYGLPSDDDGSFLMQADWAAERSGADDSVEKDSRNLGGFSLRR